MAATLVASTSKYDGNGNAGYTTDPINTTGANLLIIVKLNYFGLSSFVPTDSKNNTWQELSEYGGAGIAHIRFYYAYSPTVGTDHTFSCPVNGESTYSTLIVFAYSGMVTGSTVFDAATGDDDASSGSVTPAASGELIISGYSTFAGTTYTPDGSFTRIFNQAFSGGVCMGGAVATINPYNSTNAVECTWTGGGTAESSNIAAFKIAAAGAAFNPAWARGSNHFVGEGIVS